MWKYVSRGLRESLERNLGLSWNSGKRKEPPSQQHCSKFTSFSRATSRSSVCGVSKWPQCRQQSQGSSDTPPPNEEDPSEQHRKTEFSHDQKDCLLGAVSFSSALVLGWVLTQPYYHWRKWWSKEHASLRSRCPLASSILCSSRDPLISCRYRICDPISGLLKGLNLTRLLPVSLAAPNTSPVLLSNSDGEDSRQHEIEYGPLTADQALEEAVGEVRMAHDKTLSVYENRRGVEAASRHRHAKAVALFRSASARSYAPAQYNLAQCYELGLGTKQDFAKAAEWYHRAAELGHEGAMYNLAVFHAHGWGGLEADSNKSRQLLVMAAERGQPDARAALGYPGQPSPPSITPMIDKEDFWTSSSQNEEVPEEPSDSRQHFSNNPSALYNLAQSFENSSNNSSPDPYLIMDLYKFASELGHSAAKARLQILQTYDAVGLLNEFLFLDKNKAGDLCDADFLLEQN